MGDGKGGRGRKAGRRTVLAGMSAAAGLAAMPLRTLADLARANAPIGSGEEFSFEKLSRLMQQRSGEPYRGPADVPLLLTDLDYDGYRKIAYRPERARWREENVLFQVHAFHRGWLFPDPVALYDVQNGMAGGFSFTTQDFEYREGLKTKPPADTEIPAIAGWRMTYPLNRPDRYDEVVAFLGASYFRALGEGNFYGASARGLALNTATGQSEEFPRFSAFYLEHPAPGDDRVVINAALESESATGAYRIVLMPGATTVMDVTARIFFRQAVEEMGIAPLTSMFLYDETSRMRFDDYRPQVHDSHGLRLDRGDGTVIWRPLANPTRLAGSYYAVTNPRAFGLHQRERAFEAYQDGESRYDRRPSIEIEPVGDWGPGHVRLVEIPADLEINDNIVAYWVPEQPAAAGQSREFRYRIKWGDLPPQDDTAMAYVARSATGPGGVSGTAQNSPARKFVVDFAGSRLAELPGDADVTAEVSVNGGEVANVSLGPLADMGRWRLAVDVVPQGRNPVEMSAWIAGYGRRLTEIWSYQWVRE